jgi:hypothetical protein
VVSDIDLKVSGSSTCSSHLMESAERGASVGSPDFTAANKPPSLLWPWLVLSAIWVAGVFFFEPLAGRSSRSLVVVFSTAFLPPLVPPLLLNLLVRVLAQCFRP